MWSVGPFPVILTTMSHNPDLSKAVLSFFQLWQRQVAAMSRNPEAGVADLLATYNELAAAFSQEKNTETGPHEKLDNE